MRISFSQSYWIIMSSVSNFYRRISPNGTKDVSLHVYGMAEKKLGSMSNISI